MSFLMDYTNMIELNTHAGWCKNVHRCNVDKSSPL